MIVNGIKTRLFNERESLTDFIFQHIPQFENGNVLVVASKIVALAQGRTCQDKTEKEKYINEEATATVQNAWCTMALLDGRWSANAGIDESNAGDKLILFPTELDKEASDLRHAIMKKHTLSDFAVVITDSRSTPLRAGVTASAVASAGLKPMRSYVEKPDLMEIPIKFTELNIVDSLATTAGILMGEGDESTPLVLIKDAPVEFTDQPTPLKDLNIPAQDDLYCEIFKSVTD